MASLLRLREWLSPQEAVQYLNEKGVHHGCTQLVDLAPLLQEGILQAFWRADSGYWWQPIPKATRIEFWDCPDDFFTPEQLNDFDYKGASFSGEYFQIDLKTMWTDYEVDKVLAAIWREGISPNENFASPLIAYTSGLEANAIKLRKNYCKNMTLCVLSRFESVGDSHELYKNYLKLFKI